MVWILSTIQSSASSQVIRLNLPSPRSPTRSMGYFTRSGLLIFWTLAHPFRHRCPWVMGWSGSPSSLMTFSSLI